MARLTLKQWLVLEITKDKQKVYDNLYDQEKHGYLLELEPKECVEELFNKVDDYDMLWDYVYTCYHDYNLHTLPSWTTLLKNTTVTTAAISHTSHLNTYISVINGVGNGRLNIDLDVVSFSCSHKVYKWGIAIGSFNDPTNVYLFCETFILYLPNLDNKQVVTFAELRANLTAPLAYHTVVCLV